MPKNEEKGNVYNMLIDKFLVWVIRLDDIIRNFITVFVICYLSSIVSTIQYQFVKNVLNVLFINVSEFTLCKVHLSTWGRHHTLHIHDPSR